VVAGTLKKKTRADRGRTIAAQPAVG